jgi:NitT/TauT family transport system substrate-binding protein
MSRSLLILLPIALLILSACVPIAPPTTPVAGDATSAPSATEALTPVTLAMGYIPSVQFAPFYVAQERGYFRDAGLDVTFRHGFETDLLKLVGTDELSFMIGSGEEVILGRSQGLPVRYVMRWYRRFPVVLFAKAAEGIDSPQNLEGKRVGIPGLFGASYVGWQAIVYASGIDASKVSLESIGFTQATAVSRDQVDAALDYVVNGPVQLRLAGEEVTELAVADYVDLPSNGIITNEKTLAERPDQVRAVVAAAMRGLEDTLADPDAAYEISLKYLPEAVGAQEEVSRAIFDASLELWQAPAGELGVSDPAAWAKAASFMKEMGLIQSEVAVDDLYSNDYLPE